MYLKYFSRSFMCGYTYKECEENNGETQFGFREGTREALFAVQVLVQRCRDVNCDV